MFLIICALIFSIFVLNVVLGAFASASFMGDVPEMVTLFIASLFFVAAILKRESDAKDQAENSNS